MIRVCVVDDHPALRTGLWTVIRCEPGMNFAGSASEPDEAIELVERVRPDVALVDYQLPGEDGILLCQRLKNLSHPPKVIIYSAYSDPSLAIPAILAGADGITNKAGLADELLSSIREVARGRTVVPPIPGGLRETSAAKLEPEEHPIFSMMLDRTPFSEVAQVMGISESELRKRLRTMLGKLRVATQRSRPRMVSGTRSAAR
jgi:DNA-binding NarL/FixJ family response regulator